MIIFELCEDKVFQANTLAANGFDEYVLTDDEFEVLGPKIQDLVLHSEGSNFSGGATGFQYRVVIQTKSRNGPWLTDTTTLVQALQAGANAGNYVVGIPYGVRSFFGRKIRLVLQVAYGSGTTPQRGNLTASVAVRLFAN